LVCDIPTGDGKIANLFLQCIVLVFPNSVSIAYEKYSCCLYLCISGGFIPKTS
jgi:hypothetical protein